MRMASRIRLRKLIAWMVLTVLWILVADTELLIAREERASVFRFRLSPAIPAGIAVGAGLLMFGEWAGSAKLWRVVIASPLLYLFGALVFCVANFCGGLFITEVVNGAQETWGVRTLFNNPVGLLFFALVAVITLYPVVAMALTIFVVRWSCAPRQFGTAGPSDSPESTTRAAEARESYP